MWFNTADGPSASKSPQILSIYVQLWWAFNLLSLWVSALGQRESNLPKRPRNYPAKFGCKLVELFDLMKAEKSGLPELPSDLPSTEEIFESMTFEDNWSESWVVEVCHYLRGGKHLRIPPSFVKLLPKRL